MKTTAKAQTRHLSSAERRFRNVMYHLRTKHRPQEKETQVEIAYHVKNITDRGFGFFPNHYVMDDIIALEGISRALQAKQEKQ
tara:strand:+ start:635 stop:883 length:249 start_codon:yes stop_codon:yes gene_type:complete